MNKITTIFQRATLVVLALFGHLLMSQEVPFSARLTNNGNNYINIKGDYTFLSNSVMNRVFSNGTGVNTPYNGSGSNNSLHVEYVDIDSDPTTFSSSSSTLSLPSCSQIYWAGLYWAGNYDAERLNEAGDFNNNFTVDTSRSTDFVTVKLQVPGGSYVDLTADNNPDPVGEEDAIIIDGFNNTPNDPYVCFKNVTNNLRALADPSGEYVVANVRGTRGSTNHGAAGWTLVVVYENPTLPGRYISVYDGYEGITTQSGNRTADITVSGFNTIPVGPVNARIGVSALEGETSLDGDTFGIVSNSSSTFTDITNAANPDDNFFNSTITNDGVNVTTRSINSTNAIGFDSDVFDLDNPANSIIDNGDTSATLRLGTDGDWFASFLVTFAVEIIEPTIVLEKKVEDVAGNDITGLGVNLGQVLDYVLRFQNTGNDNATEYTIRDVLPINTTLNEAYFTTPGSLPTGVTYVFDPATRAVTFTIPDNLVEEDDPIYEIRMRVRVAENCFDFVDACTDLIENVAYSTYRGVINDNQISDDPSVSDFDACGFVTPGATNFLLDDLENCNYIRSVQLCGADVLLDAGDNFDNYIWYEDVNTNGIIDGADRVVTDADSDNDPSTLLVNDTGTYIVDKIVADPCKGFKEIIQVSLFGATQANPITALINDTTNDIDGEVLTCPNDGDELPQIFLCGLNDTELLQINIPDADSIVWEQLDESSCGAAPADCANKDNSCTWNVVQTGNDFLANASGQFRVVVNYQNGCFSRFYFNVFQNTLDVQYNTRDIVCQTPGNITITNLGAGYGYQLYDVANNVVVEPYSAGQGPSFDITTNGVYRVDIAQLDTNGDPILDGCIFSTADEGILNRTLTTDIITTEANCNAQGSIQINALNVFPNYSYELRLDDGTPAPTPPTNDPYQGLHPGGTFIDDETAQLDNTHTFNVNEGNYFVITRTDDGCIDVKPVTVTRVPDPTLSALTTADIGCNDGEVTLTATNGNNASYFYAIWSRNGTDLYADTASIPPADFQTSNTFAFVDGEEGDYEFVVVDANNCVGFSNVVTVRNNGVLAIDSITAVEPACSGDANGQLTINITGGVGPFQYSIDGGATYQPTPNFVGLSAGPYSIRVLDTTGCDVTLPYELNQPFPLSASAGVSRDATCDPSNGAEVRITNVVGGSGTYEYSFDGGTTWGASSIATLPPGDYTVLVRDGSCSFPMDVTVEGLPMPPNVALTPEVIYNCDGTGTITASPSIAGYDYRYAIDGVLNTPEDNNVFTNVSPGTYTVRTYYTSQTPPVPSLLLQEDFGVGNGSIPSPDTQGYTYEDQTGSTAGGGDANNRINDFEYSITNEIVAPFAPWVNPNDHTNPSDPNGRFLVINVGTPSPGQIIYTKPINDVIPNRPLRVSLHIFNLLSGLIGNTQLDPDLTIEIRTTGGAVIESIRTGAIAKNTGIDDWVLFTADLDPGANTSLEFVIRSEISGNSGNDLAIDDIEIFQIPEVCELFVDTPVTVAAGQVFSSAVQSSTNVSCNGFTDGTITFTVENFDAVAGFDYSEDGGTTWINSTTSPITTNAVFGAGTHTIPIRKANEITCTTSVTAAITEPTVIVPTASVTTALTCTNDAVITANASGGTPTYIYQLEDNVGGIIGAYDFTSNGSNRIFPGLTDGTYIVRVRDANGCEATTTALVISPLNPVVFNLTETLCHTGGNTASIQVDVTNGNGGYQFRIDAGPWLTPTPTSASTYTFNNLSSGTYDIDVRDQSGCPVALATQTVTINPQLTVSATAPNITACGTDTNISITANGGDGNYVYAVVADGVSPLPGDFSAANPVNVAVAGDYDIYVRDNASATGFCSAMFDYEVIQDAPLNFTPTPTDVSCFGGADGAIDVVVNSGGQSPYMYSIDNGATYVTGSNFPNLSAATYQVRVRDANLCESAATPVVVDQPNELQASTAQTLDYTCAQLGAITVTPTSGGSGNYQYSLNGGSWTASTTGAHVFNNLADGTYSVRVRDANAIGCVITLTNVIIAPLPVPPTVSSVIDYNCDGTGNVTISPFNASFTYVLNGVSQTGATGNIFNNIAAGNYSLRITYSPDCHVDSNVVVVDGNAFGASFVSATDVSCNGLSDATITFEVENFDAVTGFEYSEDGGTTWVTSLTSPVTTNAVFGAGLQTIPIRRQNDVTCVASISHTIVQPALVEANASVTTAITCTNGATITASATGGSPTYEYQLEINNDGDNTAPYNITSIVRPFQTSTVFTNVIANLAGESYVVRVRDRNSCEDVIDTAIIINDPTNIVFDATPTPCYSGANDGQIVVNVTAGNGGYQFRIDGGPWITPSPATTTTYTFENLSNGTYAIEVRDQLGCPLASNAQSITLNPQLLVDVDVTAVSACADGLITVNATGGNGTLLYAIVPANTAPSSYTATNTLTVTNAMATANPAGFDVYVVDNNDSPAICTFLQEDIVLTPVAALSVSGTPTDPLCYDGLGDIDVTITGGIAPYNYTLVDLSPADGIDYGRTSTNVSTTTLPFNGIGVGDYRIDVTDVDGCPASSLTITINNAIEIMADIRPILPAICNDPDPNEYGFEFDNVVTPAGTVEYSDDGGTTWQASPELRNNASGTEVFPSIRVEVAPGIYCQRDFDRYIIPFPLDDLDITLFPQVLDCNDLQVTVRGSNGDDTIGYRYTYTDDPSNFGTSTPVWTARIPTGTSHTFANIDPVTPQLPGLPLLVPGRTYVFYVEDGSGCIRQSNVNVNEVPSVNLPIEITADVTPTCDSATTGNITFTLTPDTSYPSMRWEVYEVGNATPVAVSGGGASAVNVIFSTSISVNGLAEGDYYVDVIQVDGTNTDACRGASENIYVPELPPLSATATATRDISCNLPGLISITNITGGGGAPYTFDVSGPSGFTTINGTTDNPVEVPVNSPAGNYTVTLYDQYSCPLVLNPVPLTLSPNPTITSVTHDNCTLPFEVTVVGNSAAGGLRYAMVDAGDPAPTTFDDNGGVFSPVAPGTYDFYVMDANGCIGSQTGYVVHPLLTASATLTKTLDCTGSPEAVINIAVADGSGTYQYSITNDTGGAEPPVGLTNWPDITGVPVSDIDYQTLVAGNYTITIFDVNTPNTVVCNREFTVNVPARLEPMVDAIATTDVTCIGDNDGTITISAVDNGIGPFDFEITSLDGGAVSIAPSSFTNTSATFTNLVPTTGVGYIVTITGDAATNNCPTTSAPITIAEPNTINVTLNTPVQFGCTVGNTTNNANISVQNVTGGSSTYVRYRFYRTDDPLTVAVEADADFQDGTSDSYTITDLNGGYYAIEVYDDQGCLGLTNTRINPFVEISDPTVAIDVPVTCNGNDAEVSLGITLNPVSATPTLRYSVEGTDNPYSQLNQASNSFTLLGVGSYIATVTNADTGCFVQTPFEIDDPNNFEITPTVTNVVCDGTDGSVTFAIADAINPYAGGFSYQVFEQVTNNPETGVLNHPNPGPTAAVNLPAGDYYVVVAQTNNPLCSNQENFSIAGPNGPITATPLVTPISCVPGNDGVIQLTDVQGGWGGYQYYVSTTPIPNEFDISNYTTNPRFENLGAGTYEIWIIDQNGCPRQFTDEVLATPPAIVADLRINQGNCTGFDGEIEVVGIPATDPISGGQGSNYSYQLYRNTVAVGTPQSSTIFNGLGEGSYTVEITDQLGCSLIVGPQVLFDVIAPNADIVKTIDCISGGEITITQTGGSGNFTYSVVYPVSGTIVNEPTGVFTNLPEVGDYVFTITDTATGHVCSTTVTQRLEDRVLPNLAVDSFSNVTCNGAGDGTISVNANPDNGIGPYSFEIVFIDGAPASVAATSINGATAFFDGLSAATMALSGTTYVIRVTAANGCTEDVTQVLTQPEPVSNVTATVVPFGCAVGNNASNASVVVDVASIIGGSGNYTRFEFINTGSGLTVQDGPNSVYVETDYAGGNYDIYAYDDMGCGNVVAENVTINPFVVMSDPTVTNVVGVTCTPGSDAQIQVGVTLNPVSATPTLEYTISGIGFTYTDTNNTGLFGGLQAGNYQITITDLDANPNCVLELVHTIEEPEEMQVMATKLTDEECLNNGVDDGSFNIAISNYTGTYSYQVFDTNNNPITGQSGTGNTSAPLAPFANISGGSYYVQVTQTQAPFCIENSNAITITAPDAPIAAVVTEEIGVSCSNDQGQVSIVASGGEGPYTIVLNNTTTSQLYTENNVSANLFSGLSAGVYTYTVTDMFNCSETGSITLIQPDAIVATITPSALTCFGDNTASVSAGVNSRNVTPSYNYLLNIYADLTSTTPLQVSAQQGSSSFPNLGPGFYSITVTDDAGCSDETDRVQITAPDEVVAQLVRTSPLTCLTGVELELMASGGTGGAYEYFNPLTSTWIAMSGGNSETFPNANFAGPLFDGTYQFRVRDANLCESLPSNEITEDPIMPLTLTVDTSAAVINCTGESTAIIFADADGGLGNYQFELYADASLSVASRIAGPQALGEFRDLPMGDYYVNVISGDCLVSAVHVPIVEPTPLTYVDEVTNVSCSGDANGAITVTLSGGAGGYQYAISPNLDQFDDENMFTDLAPGDYQIIAQDQNGCFELLEYTITQPDPITLDTVSVLHEVCQGSEDGSFEISITGGTAPYRTSLNSNADADYVQDQFMFDSLAANTYVVFVKDALDCEGVIVVDIEPGVNLNAVVTPVYECDGIVPDNFLDIAFEDNTIIPDVLYAMDSTDPAAMQLTADFTNLAPGNHSLTIAHANGCVNTIDFVIEDFQPLTLMLENNNVNEITAIAAGGLEDYTFYFGDVDNATDNTFIINRTDTYTVRLVDQNGCEAVAEIFMEFIDIEIPNFFTPDGDDQNDFWKPRNLEAFPNVLMIIFDRYGRELYRMEINDDPWDGVYNNQSLPTGDYWYVIKLKGENDDREFVGHFTLYR
ncbi:T9SS type B sorting domain-containing protein [uncultured Croceitalea sp.]|uniref:T9SS type B sorting domain-containing protein n=1 Tax=uncultured Croceitalea sp. TaxID=1798908 RepID=UPI0033060D2D